MTALGTLHALGEVDVDGETLPLAVVIRVDLPEDLHELASLLGRRVAVGPPQPEDDAQGPPSGSSAR